MTTRTGLLSMVVVFGVCASGASAQLLGEFEDRMAFRASDGRDTDFFGYSMAVSGRVAAAGAFLAGNDNRGAAYMFRYDEANDVWNEEQKLQASDAASGDEFGVDVDTTGSVTVVGAFFDDIDGLTNAGSAYVFRYDTGSSTWVEEQKLVPADPEVGAQFGKAVAISGNVIVLGAALDDEGGNNAGAAYVFRYDPDTMTWNEEQKIIAQDAAGNERFGVSVDVEGNWMLIGAWQDDEGGNDAGAVYAFEYTGGTWVESQKIIPDDVLPDDRFGLAITLRGTVALLSSRAVAGRVYWYDRSGSTWSMGEVFDSPDGVAGDQFGVSATTQANWLLIGAPFHDASGQDTGAIYGWRRVGGEWREEVKLVHEGAESGDQMGAQVSMLRILRDDPEFDIVDCLSAGSLMNDSRGEVRVFDLTRAELFFADCNANTRPDGYDVAFRGSKDCNGNGLPDECDIATGRSIDADGNGIPDECEATCDADFNGDGNVDIFDILDLLSEMDAGCDG